MTQTLESAGMPEDAAAQQAAWRSLPRRLFGALVALDLLFVAAHLGLVFMDLRRTVLFTAFDLGVESNIPTAYSAFQLLLVGMALLVLGSPLVPVRRKTAELRLLWRVVGAGFVFLAFDEIGMVHERLPTWRLRVFNVPHLDPWMVMYAAAGVVAALVLGGQVLLAWKRWRRHLVLFLAGMAVYVAGGFVLEAVNYLVHFKGLMRYIEMAFEEGFEMLGVSIGAWGVWGCGPGTLPAVRAGAAAAGS